MQVIDENTFSDVIVNSKPAVIVFGASWCGPCKQLLSMFKQIENDFTDKVGFYKLDIDESSSLTNLYNIKSVPTILIFKNNQLVCTKVGTFATKVALYSFIHENTN